MKIFLKAILAVFMINCVLISPFTSSTAMDNAPENSSATSQNKIDNSQNLLKEDYYARWIFDRIVDVKEFDPSLGDSIGLRVDSEQRNCLLDRIFSVGSFKITRIKLAGSEWDVITCNDTLNLNLYGKPSVPYKKILIPLADTQVTNIIINEKIIDTIAGRKVLPGPKPLQAGASYPNWTDPSSSLERNFYAEPMIYCSDREFPSEFVKQEVISSNGNRFLALTVFPFRFDPKNNVIKVYDVHVKIELSKPVPDSIQEQKRLTSGARNEGYVIVAPSRFFEAVQSFAEWKSQIGFSVQFKGLEEIYSQYNGRDTPEKLRSFINMDYHTNGTQYYLLIGDSDICPVREVWDPADAGVGLDNGTEPSDLYYECLDGTWDANGNGVFGELDDDADLYPEVKVGRIPLSDTEDVRRTLARIRKIEEAPEAGEWIKNFLLIAPTAFTAGDSAAALEEELNNKFLADSFFNVIRSYDTDNSLSTANVVSAMNSGVGLVDFFDHGAYNTWYGALQTPDVLNLYNGNKTFLAYAMACETAAFDYQQYTTISEAFFRNPWGGAIGYIGATRISWAGYDCFDGLHHRFWNCFLESVLRNLEANPKQALHEAIAEMTATYIMEGPARETVYEAIYFGDPALELCWKQNTTTTVTPNLETEEEGTANGTCLMLHSGKPIEGQYKAIVADPTGTTVTEQTGSLGSEGNYTIHFTTTSIPGNYTIQTTITNPFNYTEKSTFSVGTLNVTARLDSNPIYGDPLKVLGQALEESNPVVGMANISIIDDGRIVNSLNVPTDDLGQFQASINLTSFGRQTVHAWVSSSSKHGGTSIEYKVKRGDILVIPYDSGDRALIYPGGWFDLNRGSSTSYHSFHRALADEYDVSIYRILYETVPSLTFLQQYSAVMVSCGDHYGSCLTSAQRNLTDVLTQYHSSGGDLMFEGGDIASSLASRNLTGFMESVLHVMLFQDLANDGLYLDNKPHPITQGLPSQIPLAKGLGSPSVDLVLPVNGSEKASGYGGYTYSCNSITTLPASSGTGSVVYFSFSVDGIENLTYRDLLIQNSAEYLLSPTLNVELSDYALLSNTSETISVQVRDSDTKQPIPNAIVAAEGCGVAAQNETTSNGRCDIFVAPTSAGILNVTTKKTGYPNFTTQIIVYGEPKLTARAVPERIRRTTQTVSIEVTDFYEGNAVDLANVTLSDCGVSVTDYTDSAGTINFTVTPTSYGRIQLNASKLAYENYTGFVDVFLNSVVVDSFGTDYPVDSSWDDLNSAWSEYGSIPIRVDVNSLNKNMITYQDLIDSEADVLIISCSAAAGREYSDEEISAIKQYTIEGHGLIATAGTFYEYIPNNNKLAPLFGMREDMNYLETHNQRLALNVLEPHNPLFMNIPPSYRVGCGMTVCPLDQSWDQIDLADATVVAKSKANESIIVTYNGAVFVTHWIEYMSNSLDFQLMYNAIVWSKYEAPEHDLKVSLNAWAYMTPYTTAIIEARIDNAGRNNQTDVNMTILSNGAPIYDTSIPMLLAGASRSISFSWTSANEGTYNITAYVEPVVDEVNTLDNNATRLVIVRYPLINPIEGQYARYYSTYYATNGTQVGYENLNLSYAEYVAPCIMLVMIESECVLRMNDSVVTIRITSSMRVNILTRVVEGFGDAYWFPYWIEKNITLNSIVNLGYLGTRVASDKAITFNGHSIDCWLLESNLTLTYSSTSFYDKASGLLIGGEDQMQNTTTFLVTIGLQRIMLTETNIPIGVQHELEASLDAPTFLSLGGSAQLNATVSNLGWNPETNVKLEISINGSVVSSETITELGNGSSSRTSYLWSPAKKGTYNITAYVYPVVGEDSIANNAFSEFVTVTADDTLPTVLITAPLNEGLTNQTWTLVNWTGSDCESGIAHYCVYLNDELFANVTGDTTSHTLTGLVEGLNKIAVVAYDGWNNCGSDQITLIADFTQPTAAILAPTNRSFLRGSLSIIYASYDDHLGSTELYINGENKAIFSNSGTYVYVWDTTLLEDGDYTIRLLSYDKAGNEASVQITVNVDNSAPSVEWVSPASGSCLSGIANLGFNFSDLDLFEAKLTIDGQNLASVTGQSSYPFDTRRVADGLHTIALTVSDKAGNLNSTEYIAIIVDNTLPTAKILTPQQMEIMGSLCVVHFTFNDANLESAILRINAAPFDVKGTVEFSLNTTEIPDGNCNITLTVTDKAGHSVVETVTFEIDNTKPIVNITNPGELSGVDLVGAVTIRFSCSDKNLERTVLHINETAIEVTGQELYEWNTTTVGDGTHLMKLVVYDKAGNMAETPTLTARTTNVQQSTRGNYLEGWDLGLRWGSIIGLAIGLAIGLVSLLVLRKKKRASTA